MLRPAALAAAALVLLAVLPPGTAQATEVYPGLDLDAALSVLEREPVHRVPAAQARFDEAQVRPMLDPDVRILVIPYTPLDLTAGERYDIVDGPVRDWASDRDLDVLLVVGTQVRIVGEGTVGATSLDELRQNLAHLDVTASLLFALTYLRTGEKVDLGGPSGGVEDPAERDAALAGLQESRVVALEASPGTEPGDPLVDGPWIDEILPGGRVRIVALPPLDVGAPDRDLLGPLSAAHPDDVVLVLRGRWLEATGPDADEVRSARDYVLGRYEEFLLGRALPPRGTAVQFLQRLALLRSGEPFGRPRPEPVVADAVVARWAGPVATAAAVGLGITALLAAAGAARRRATAAAASARHERARAAAALAALDAEVLADGAPVESAAAAAERRDTAYALLEHAREPGEFRAARTAAEEGRVLLSGSSR